MSLPVAPALDPKLAGAIRVQGPKTVAPIISEPTSHHILLEDRSADCDAQAPPRKSFVHC
jgi:hypothetical protein